MLPTCVGRTRWNRPKLFFLGVVLERPESLPLADELATKYSVMLAPGSAFGYEHHLRLGVGQRPDIFKAGLNEAGKCFDEVRSSAFA